MPERGGMDTNPFGGEARIDRINLLEYLEPSAPSEKVLFSCIVQDAASNYLYAFLGKNGTSVEEFFSAWQYFFKVKSADKPSWNHHRTTKITYNYRGQKVIENRYLTDIELQFMCFDKHYDMSGLSNYMNIDKFRSGLKERRRSILDNNWEQVQNYVNNLYKKELDQIANGQQVPLQVWSEDLKDILVDPPTPAHLANAIYVPSKLKRPKRQRASRKQSTGISPRSEESTVLSSNWGPLSQLLLEGAENDKVVPNHSVGGIHRDTN